MPLLKTSILIIVSLLGMELAVWSSKTDALAPTISKKEVLSCPGAGKHAAILFAQNEEKKPKENEENGLSLGRDEPDSGSTKKPGEKGLPTEPTPKQLKPFIPSEKIEVDQSVDFPYDI